MQNPKNYRLACTLTFGDIYGQIIIWLIVIFLSLAAALALMGAGTPLYALATVGLILVLSLPFLLFAFVTTLLNNLEIRSIDSSFQAADSANKSVQAVSGGTVQTAS